MEMKVLRPAFHGSYETARSTAQVVAGLGWLVIAVGAVAALIGFASMRQMGPFAMLGVVTGILIAVVGLLQVAAGQGVRAAVDAADYARQSLRLQIAQAEGLAEVDLAGSAASSGASYAYDVQKWNALAGVDPDIAAAVAQVEPYGRPALAELATKYLALDDKRYLATIVKQIAEKYSAALAVQLEGRQWDELGRKVDMVWRTPWGTIARLHDDRALVIRPEGYEILPSLGEFHRRYRGQSESWVEISDIEEKRRFFREARLVLQELNSR